MVLAVYAGAQNAHVRFSEEQNFNNPGTCSISYFVIKHLSSNRSWRPSSKRARKYVSSAYKITTNSGFNIFWAIRFWHLPTEAPITTKTTPISTNGQKSERLAIGTTSVEFPHFNYRRWNHLPWVDSGYHH